MTSVSKIMYVDKLDETVIKYNRNYHSAIKVKPVYVKSNTYIDSNKGINNKYPKIEIGDIVRISKYENIFAKAYVPNWFQEVFVIRKIENTVPWRYFINDLNEEEIVGSFCKKHCQI